MSAQERFEKAKNMAKTLRSVRNYVKEVRDLDESMSHTTESQQQVSDAIDFLHQWEDKLQRAEASKEDLEQLRRTRRELAVFHDVPNECDIDGLAEDMKTLYYTMVAHTTILYVQAKKEDTLDQADDMTFQ